MNPKKDNHSGSKLSLICGIVGMVGCFAVMLANVAGIIVVEKHNPISETISKLAIGKYAWIQDLGLDFFAAALFAIAIGLYAWNLGGAAWKVGSVLLGVLGVDILLIAEHNQYAGREGVGASIHIYCVYALGAIFTLLTILLAFGLRNLNRRWYHFSLSIAVIWTILAPFFFIAPTSWNGAYERFLALIMLTWVTAISWLLIRRGIGQVSETT
ncbi:MAG: DUF998 domain-containing protein [Elainellaceae cyanobacterium]